MSGEKSTSWGNTVITLLFTQVVIATHIAGDAYAGIKLLESLTASGACIFEKTASALLVEGDDSLLCTDLALGDTFFHVGALLGFKTDLQKHFDSSGTFCKLKVTLLANGFECHKPFSNAFQKIGWCTKPLTPGSRKAAVITQARLLTLMHDFPNVSGVRDFAASVLS